MSTQGPILFQPSGVEILLSVHGEHAGHSLVAVDFPVEIEDLIRQYDGYFHSSKQLTGLSVSRQRAFVHQHPKLIVKHPQYDNGL